MRQRSRYDTRRKFMEKIGSSIKKWNRKIIDEGCEKEVERKLRHTIATIERKVGKVKIYKKK